MLHYVQGTRDFGMHYLVDAQLDMIGFIDSYWDGDRTDMKYTSGFVFILGYDPICWPSKKQTSLALSLAKAEYMGVVNETIQAVWLYGILTEFGIFTYPLV